MMMTHQMQLYYPSFSAFYRTFQRLSGGSGEWIYHQWNVPLKTRQKQSTYAGLV